MAQASTLRQHEGHSVLWSPYVRGLVQWEGPRSAVGEGVVLPAIVAGSSEGSGVGMEIYPQRQRHALHVSTDRSVFSPAAKNRISSTWCMIFSRRCASAAEIRECFHCHQLGSGRRLRPTAVSYTAPGPEVCCSSGTTDAVHFSRHFLTARRWNNVSTPKQTNKQTKREREKHFGTRQILNIRASSVHFYSSFRLWNKFRRLLRNKQNPTSEQIVVSTMQTICFSTAKFVSSYSKKKYKRHLYLFEALGISTPRNEMQQRQTVCVGYSVLRQWVEDVILGIGHPRPELQQPPSVKKHKQVRWSASRPRGHPFCSLWGGGSIHTGRARITPANGTCCCQWECSHYSQATSKKKLPICMRITLHVLCELGLKIWHVDDGIFFPHFARQNGVGMVQRKEQRR